MGTKTIFLNALLGLCLTGSLFAEPLDSMLGSQREKGEAPEGAFIRIEPTTTSMHYSPFPTEVYLTAEDDFQLELCFRVLDGTQMAEWGTIFGNTQANRANGFHVRLYQGTSKVLCYYPMISRITGKTADNTDWYDASEWSILEFDSTKESPEIVTLNGQNMFHWPGYIFDSERFTETQQLYIGEGPRNGGAAVSTDWKYVKIWKNGELIREYVPHPSGGFSDLANGGKVLEKDKRSSTVATYMWEED